MDKPSRKKHYSNKLQNGSCHGGEEKGVGWEFINMTEQEEDIICRMHKLVGDKWELIAGRIPGRSAAEIQRFWVMRSGVGPTNQCTINKPDNN